MNIFKWITGKTGKMALSAMQAVGLSAVVGVAGIAAWQYLDSPAETNNTFNPAAYNPGEVVYVAGANTGSYAGGSYAGGGESSSSVQISTNTFKRLEQQEMAQRAAEEMAEYAPDYSSAAAVPSQAYQMGGTDGLGTGGNAANELALKNNPMAAMQQNMAGVSDMVAKAQQQAQQQSQASAPDAQKGASLASASKNWGSSSATGGASGNAFNASFSVQDSGKNAPQISASEALKQAGDVVASAQASVKNTMEGARLRAKSSFGSENIGANHDASVKGFRTSKEAKDLQFIAKRSNDAAKNRNRAANEGARAFLASTKISGGMMISSENVTTGQGQGSKDFESSTNTNLRGLKTWQTEQEVDAQKRKKARDDLRKWIWIATPLVLALAPFIARAAWLGSVLSSNPFTAAAGAAFWAIAGVLAAIAIAPCITLLAKGIGYANKYGGSALSTWANVLGGTLTVIVGVSLIPAVGRLLSGLTNWIVSLGGLAAGLGSAWLTTGLTKDAALDDPDSLLNSEVDADQGNAGAKK